MSSKKLTYADLFSGVGGMSLGFMEHGFQNIFSIDCDSEICQTYRQNFPKHTLLEKKIEDLSEKELREFGKINKPDVIIGGTPCQGFSIAGNIGRTFVDDPRNHLFKEFARIVSVLKPKFFVVENVARVYNHNQGRTRKEIIDLFEKMNYTVDCRILKSEDYGVPQLRRRIFFIGNRLGLKNPFPTKVIENTITVKDALKDLPKLTSGESSDIPNHAAMNHSEQMLEKMSYVTSGGSREQIPEEIRPKKGDVRKYIKYDKSKPSVCITGDMRKVFHYSQNRALTVRELARLQSFPDDFVFCGTKISQQQQVGNAVPPPMAAAVANEIKKCLSKKV